MLYSLADMKCLFKNGDIPSVFNKNHFEYNDVVVEEKDRYLKLSQFEYVTSFYKDVYLVKEFLKDNEVKLRDDPLRVDVNYIDSLYEHSLFRHHLETALNKNAKRLLRLLEKYLLCHSGKLNNITYRCLHEKLLCVGFDIINLEKVNEPGSPYTRDDIGMALIKDTKGNLVKSKLGKTVGKLFPTLSKQFINFYVEAMKDADESNVEYFVHEGSKRIHFRYAYAKASTTDRNPTLNTNVERGAGKVVSLIASCLRGTVIAPEIGINDLNGNMTVNFCTELRERGIHPAEIYASGDFSIVYITDKPDPLDKDGTVFSRTIITHFKIDLEAMKADPAKWDIDKIGKEIVNVGPIYTTSDVVTGLAKEYLNEKYNYTKNNLTDCSTCLVYQLFQNYRNTSYYVDDMSDFIKVCKKLAIRFPRLLCFDKQGKRLKMIDFLGGKNNRIEIISVYIDRNGSMTTPNSIIGTSESQFEITESNKNKPVYIYMIHKHFFKSLADFSAQSILDDYRGYGVFRSIDFMERCTLTKNKFKRSLMKDVVVFSRNNEPVKHKTYPYILYDNYRHTYCFSDKYYVYDGRLSRDNHHEIAVVRNILIGVKESSPIVDHFKFPEVVKDFIIKDNDLIKSDDDDTYLNQKLKKIMDNLKERDLLWLMKKP